MHASSPCTELSTARKNATSVDIENGLAILYRRALEDGSLVRSMHIARRLASPLLMNVIASIFLFLVVSQLVCLLNVHARRLCRVARVGQLLLLLLLLHCCRCCCCSAGDRRARERACAC